MRRTNNNFLKFSLLTLLVVGFFPVVGKAVHHPIQTRQKITQQITTNRYNRDSQCEGEFSEVNKQEENLLTYSLATSKNKVKRGRKSSNDYHQQGLKLPNQNTHVRAKQYRKVQHTNSDTPKASRRGYGYAGGVNYGQDNGRQRRLDNMMVDYLENMQKKEQVTQENQLVVATKKKPSKSPQRGGVLTHPLAKNSSECTAEVQQKAQEAFMQMMTGFTEGVVGMFTGDDTE